jgi:ferrous iron transport protein A
MRLNELRPGERAVLRALHISGAARRRLRDLGLVEGAELQCLGRSPLGDPAAYALCGAAIALRDRDSSKIEVEAREWSGS